MNDAILWLTDDRCFHAPLVGSKCAALARALQAGHRVPSGFAVTTAGLRRESWKVDVERALASLDRPWVVRSSSTAEDAPDAAFAGLFRTILGLRDIGAVLAAIEEVADSAGDETVLAYAARRGIDPHGIQMAVLVQALVPATVAGVAFSRNPLTGAEEVVIESNHGLGDTVVDGSVVPDWFRVARSGTILERRLGAKHEKLVVAGPAALRREATSPGEQQELTLSDAEVREITASVIRLEQEAGCPVDVEWAKAGAQLELLQVRPITTGLAP